MLNSNDNTIRIFSRSLILIVFSFTLLSCGGGGGGDASEEPIDDTSGGSDVSEEPIDDTSGTSTTNPVASTTVTAAELVGTWVTSCQIFEPDKSYSYIASLTLTTTDGTLDLNFYDGSRCSSQFGMSTITLSYTLGATYALDGTVAGKTAGTVIDITDTTSSLSSSDVTEYNVIALDGTSLYLGDVDANLSKDGSTPAKRPTTLNSAPYIKQ